MANGLLHRRPCSDASRAGRGTDDRAACRRGRAHMHLGHRASGRHRRRPLPERDRNLLDQPCRVGQDITLIEAEALDELEARGVAISPEQARRNVVTRGIGLDARTTHGAGNTSWPRPSRRHPSRHRRGRDHQRRRRDPRRKASHAVVARLRENPPRYREGVDRQRALGRRPKGSSQQGFPAQTSSPRARNCVPRPE